MMKLMIADVDVDVDVDVDIGDSLFVCEVCVCVDGYSCRLSMKMNDIELRLWGNSSDFC